MIGPRAWEAGFVWIRGSRGSRTWLSLSICRLRIKSSVPGHTRAINSIPFETHRFHCIGLGHTLYLVDPFILCYPFTLEKMKLLWSKSEAVAIKWPDSIATRIRGRRADQRLAPTPSRPHSCHVRIARVIDPVPSQARRHWASMHVLSGVLSVFPPLPFGVISGIPQLRHIATRISQLCRHQETH